MPRAIVMAVIGVVCLLASSPVAPVEAGVHAAQGASAQAERLDLNQASIEQLQTLPGVGERTAQLIVDYRERQGGFKKVEELMNVRGIGEKTFLRLRPLVRVGDPSSR